VVVVVVVVVITQSNKPLFTPLQPFPFQVYPSFFNMKLSVYLLALLALNVGQVLCYTYAPRETFERRGRIRWWWWWWWCCETVIGIVVGSDRRLTSVYAGALALTLLSSSSSSSSSSNDNRLDQHLTIPNTITIFSPQYLYGYHQRCY